MVTGEVGSELVQLNESCDGLVMAGHACAFGCPQHERVNSSPREAVGRRKARVLCTVTTEQSSVMLW